VHTLCTARYQEVSLDALPGVAPPESSCDWAALAFAYGFRFKPGGGQAFPEAGDQAFLTAVDSNPALLYLGTLAEHYLLAGGIVETPPFASEPLNTIVITGTFVTPDAAARLEMTINAATSDAPTVSGSLLMRQVQITASGTPSILEENTPLFGPIDPSPVLGMTLGLTDFVPISAPLPPTNCADIDALWLVEYRFASGTVLTIQGDTLWQTNIDGQQYMQYGPGIPTALNVLLGSLEIPIKAGAGTYCLDANLMDLAFPGE
jgi:hypothetical protein